MKKYWWPCSDLENLEPPIRKAAWQVGFGAVSARPVHAYAALALGFCVFVFATLGLTLWPGWPGILAGNCVGCSCGVFFYYKIMSHAMRPHIRQYLMKGV